MCLDDGGTDRKADAHAVLAAVGCGIGGQHTGEQGTQALLRNAAAVVRYLKHRPAAQREHPQGQLGHPLGVDGGIFQKVRQHLRDQHRVHGDHDEAVGQVGGNGHLGVALLEPHQHGVDQLVQHGGGLLHGHLPAVKAGDGQQVLHHPVQPLGIGTGFAKKF